MRKFEVTIKYGSVVTKKIQPAQTARQASKLVRAFYCQGCEDARLSVRAIR